MFLYCTADEVGLKTGGGVVTDHELQAMLQVGRVTRLDRNLLGESNDPFEIDQRACDFISDNTELYGLKLAHFYAGTFTKTIKMLKARGVKITYTAAAHDPIESRKAHEELGMPFPYRHMTDPILWDQYLEGYRLADIVVSPSTASARIMASLDCKNLTWMIPHGTELQSKPRPLPGRFCVGYLGAVGPDKGLVYLLKAWKQANLGKDSLLLLAGIHMPAMYGLIRHEGGGNVCCQGFVKNVSEFYNSCSVYCQPSVTEGFGIEVVEALAHGRPVIVSEGAGAADVVTDLNGMRVPAKNVAALSAAFVTFFNDSNLSRFVDVAWGSAVPFSWDTIRLKYVEMWKELLK